MSKHIIALLLSGLSIIIIYNSFVKINDISILTMNDTDTIDFTQIDFFHFLWKGLFGSFNDISNQRIKTVEKLVISNLFKESHSMLEQSFKLCSSQIPTTNYNTKQNIISIYENDIHNNDCIKSQTEKQILYIHTNYNVLFDSFTNRIHITTTYAVNLLRAGISIGCSGLFYYYIYREKINPMISNKKTYYDIENGMSKKEFSL
jgi:hypothetical protein